MFQKKTFILILAVIFILGCNTKEENVQFSINPGIYNKPVKVYIKNYKQFDSILYTLNGSEPKQNMIFNLNTSEYHGEKWDIKMNDNIIFKYKTFKRGHKPSKTMSYEVYVNQKCLAPTINYEKNVLILHSQDTIYYTINDQEDYKIYQKPIFLEEGTYTVKCYSQKEGQTKSDVSTKNITVESPKIDNPELSVTKNIVKFTCNNNVYYSFTGKDFNLYSKPLVLELGTYKITYYSSKEVNGEKIDSYVFTKDLNISDLKRDFYYKETQINSDYESKIVKIDNVSYIIERYGIKKINNSTADKISELNISKYNYTIKNSETNGNRILLLVYDNNEKTSRIIEINDSLEISGNKKIDSDSYDIMDMDSTYYYVANKKGIKRINKSSNSAEQYVSFDNITKILELNGNIIGGEKTGSYDNVEPFIGIIKNGSIIFSQNKPSNRNEYYIGYANGCMVSIEERYKLNVYNQNGQIIQSKKYENTCVINKLTKTGTGFIVTGNYINTGNPFITVYKNGTFYSYSNSDYKINALSVFQTGDTYILEGINRNEMYIQMQINENLFKNN